MRNYVGTKSYEGCLRYRKMACMENVFDWKRFWYPRGDLIKLGDGGFLVNPDTDWGSRLNPALVTFNDLTETPCLALLGEPGIGKSWALQHDSIASEEAIPHEDQGVIHVDLRSYGSEDRLVSDLFKSDEWNKWRAANHRLYVFLDSLDECLLRIDNIASLLADELSKQPVDRLHLRIACRTAPWPTILEEALKKLYGKSGFRAYELAPLRRIDVEHAADRSGIKNVPAFVARIEDLSVASLAIKPVTLKFLIDIF
jgi:predicted NACHT family NTPase